jgi:hypothetical protein
MQLQVTVKFSDRDGFAAAEYGTFHISIIFNCLESRGWIFIFLITCGYERRFSFRVQVFHMILEMSLQNSSPRK